ncbi:MAG TPA: MmcQ/YjbR family DNA-binding protein [Thermoanaerobaculia bacterium]|nr:MmcQ/YjbR family DNA-binding protein [Thermoanaerobaculia bacterium]
MAAKGSPKRLRKIAVRSGPRGGNGLAKAASALRRYALSLPEAVEDFPWGERVAKIKGKVFVFLGTDPVKDAPMSLSVKLPESGEEALTLPFTKPTGYGLGKSGWVTATFSPADPPPVDVLSSWILESYGAVAPKKLAESVKKS